MWKKVKGSIQLKRSSADEEMMTINKEEEDRERRREMIRVHSFGLVLLSPLFS